MMTLALILQACWWEIFHKCCLCLQIHLGPLLKGFTKARRVRGAEAPDTRVHQAGPPLQAGRAESGCWRWGDFARTFLSLVLITCRAASHLSHPSFPGYSPLITDEQESKSKCFSGGIHLTATEYLKQNKLASHALKWRQDLCKSPEISVLGRLANSSGQSQPEEKGRERQAKSMQFG